VRKLWYAGAAVASGVLLLAASPARADVLPGDTGTDSQAALLPGNSIAPPVGDLLSGAGGWAVTRGDATLSDAGQAAMTGGNDALTGAGTAAGQARDGLDRVRRPTNGIRMTVPLDGSRPLTRLKPGANSPDLASGLLPNEKTGPELPSADVVGGTLPRPARMLGGLPLGGGLLGGGFLGGLPLLGGLTADGQQTFDAAQRPTAAQSESFDGGLPLLGGLGGMLPANPLRRSVPGGTVPDLTGLPGGGMTILAPASSVTSSPTSTPAAASPTAQATPSAPASPSAAPATSAAPAAPADPRLHEEPIDGEAGHRVFSPDGRPVAGVDQEYK
jgi:hypothetical protein